MNARRWWVSEAAVVAAAGGIAATVAWVYGGGGWGWAALAGLLLGWHAFQARRLYSRLQGEGSGPPGGLPGAWGLLGATIDARQRRARKRWRRKHSYQKRLAAAVTALPDAVVIIDPQGGVEWCSPQAEPLLGLRWPEAVGLPLAEEIDSDDLRDLLENGGENDTLRMLSPVNPVLMLSVRVKPLTRRDKPRHLLVARDITRLHHVDRIRQDFIANVSHELRTPLTVLRGFLETMAGERDALGDWLPAIDTMANQAQRMQLLVEDLLTLSRLELDEDHEQQGATTVDVAELLAILVEEARTLSGECRHVITLDADPDIQLLGDEKELDSAFGNLLFNAVKHTPPGCRIRVIWAADGDGARYTVRDTGQGIAVEHLPRLVERFYRVDPSRSRESGGTGLGLAIVKHVLLRHDSELEISSKVDIGSSFGCRFPAARVIRQ